MEGGIMLKSIFENDYSVMFIANPDTIEKSPLMKKREINGKKYFTVSRHNLGKKLFFSPSPEATVCYNEITCDYSLFREANKMCNQTYVSYGLIDEGEEFEEYPDIYCVVFLNKEIVGTLGYVYKSKLPIRKTYNKLFLEPNAHELIRLAIKPEAGKRGSKRVADEVGEILFANTLSFYRNMVISHSMPEPPSIYISTHEFVTNYFNKILGMEIFEPMKGEINWDGIPKKSHIAYQSLNFKPMKIRLKKLLPEIFPRQQMENSFIWDWEEVLKKTSPLPTPQTAVA